MSTQLVLAVGQRTDPGRVRDHNEDSLAAVPLEDTSAATLERKGQLFLVADGMGGHAAGATASSIAVQQIMRAYYKDDSDDLRASLERAIRLANAAIFDQSRDDLAYAGMGTTLVAAVCQDSRFLVANVGDSRVYLVRDGGIRQLTQDHSWVAEAVRQGTLSAEQARHHPRRNVITRSLGNRPDVEVDFFEEGLLPGDTLVLCSDGLSGLAYDEEIRDAVLTLEPQIAADQLVDLANERGGLDNITVIIARVVQTAPAAAPKEGSALPFTFLGCLGLVIGALALAFVAFWAWGGGAFPFLTVPTPTVTRSIPWTTTPTTGTPTVVSPTSGTVLPSVTPEPPTPAGTRTPYPAPATARATAVPPTTVVAPTYPSPVITPTTSTPTATSTITPTVTLTAVPTATNTATPTVTLTATPTATSTATPTMTITSAHSARSVWMATAPPTP